LIGIAINEGYISDVNEKVIKNIPELKGEWFDQLTLKHCLNNKTGFRYTRNKTPWADRTRMYYTTDVRKLLLGVKIEKEPGKEFKSTEYAALFCGFILERAINKPIIEYFQEKLWRNIGTEYQALFNIDSEKHRFPKFESGLCARAIDFAKFGRLILNNGLWQEKQVVPGRWINELFSVNGSTLWEKVYRKYQWWGISREGATNDIFANGHFGQRIYISPSTNTIVVRMGKSRGGINWEIFIKDLVDTINQKENWGV
jgi:CubicO group peptidase (beta-lactamase class C family)